MLDGVGSNGFVVVERDRLSSGMAASVVKHRATKASVTKRVEERSDYCCGSKVRRRRCIASGIVASWNRRRLYAK